MSFGTLSDVTYTVTYPPSGEARFPKPDTWLHGRKKYPYGAWRSSVARLLWEPFSGVGGRRPASEMLGFRVSCVGQRRWASTQFLAQFG